MPSTKRVISDFWVCADPHPLRTECTPAAPCAESCWWAHGCGFDPTMEGVAKAAFLQGVSEEAFYAVFGDDLEQQKRFWKKQLRLLILSQGRTYRMGPEAHDYTIAVAPRFRESLEALLNNL